MQIMYVLAFVMALATLVSMELGPQRNEDSDQARIVVEHMAVWHKAAHDVCVGGGCASGVIDPTVELNPQLTAGDAFADDRFTSRYDAASRLLVTSLNPGFASRAAVNFGTVSAELRNAVDGESSQLGQFNKPLRRIEPSYQNGYAAGVAIILPNALANPIPDRAPVIASRL